MVCLPFMSNNENHYFFIMLILLTLSTRKIFNGCMVRVLEERNLKITNNSFTKLFNWIIYFIP